MSPATRTDPYLASNFRVEIQGIPTASFSEVSGLEVEIAAIEYRNGNDTPGSVRKLPGFNKVADVTLKRGITQDLSLWNWINSVIQGNASRQDVSIVLQDELHNDVARWNLFNAWPCKWSGPALNAKSNEVAMETLVICYERLERE
jgi:phage tail-like protein